MLIYGGIDQQNQYINNIMMLNTEVRLWKKLKVEDETNNKNPGLAFHKMIIVFHEMRKNIHMN